MSDDGAPPAPRKRSLADLLDSIEATADPAQELVNLTVAQAAARDPALAAAIRYCAIPRRFDAVVVGVLRAAPDDHDGNARLLSSLTAYSFVLPRQDGDGFVYHDETRDALLRDWQSDDAKRQQFAEYSTRLVSFYEARHEEAQRVEQDLGRVAAIIQRANPDRYLQVAAAVETRVVAPLLEALYHETLRSAAAGYDFFVRYCEPYEAASRLTVCRSLLNAARDDLTRLPDQSTARPWLKWLRYWQARLAAYVQPAAEVEAQLRDLLSETEDDTKLKLWVLTQLGRVLNTQYKLAEAGAVFEQELALSVATRLDAFNLPVSHLSLANFYWSLTDLDQALAKCRDAVESALAEGNRRAEVSARLALSGVYYDRGEWSAARDAALDALDLVRTQLPQRPDLHQAANSRWITLLAARDPRLLDTLYAESLALLPAMAEPVQRITLALEYAEAVRVSGQLARADQLRTDLLRQAAASPYPAVAVQVLQFVTSLTEDQGDVEQTIAVYSEIADRVQQGGGTDWDLAAALSNRGMQRATQGDYAGADADLQDGIARWTAMGHDRLVAFVSVALADLRRHQGNLDEAQRLLDAAKAPLLEGNSGRWAVDWYQIQGDLHRLYARRDEAATAYRRAADLSRALDRLSQTARSLINLAGVVAPRGRWAEAAEHTAAAAAIWDQYATANRYQPTARTREADAANARGMQLFTAPADERRKNVEAARDLFRSAAQAVPDNIWYCFNLAYASAELLDWATAGDAVEQALAQAPAWLRCPAVYGRLARYRQAQAEALAAGGQAQPAVDLLRATRTRLAGQAAPADLVALNLAAGDSLLALDQADAAAAEYDAAQAGAEADGAAADRAACAARLAVLAAARGDGPLVREQVAYSMALWQEAGRPEPAATLVAACAALIRTPAQYACFAAALRDLSATPGQDAAQQRQLREARLDLNRRRYAAIVYRLQPAKVDLSKPPAPVTPIILAADATLFPQGAETPQVARMIDADIPALRSRLQEGMGVTIPGLLLRADDDLHDAFLVHLNEVPVAAGLLAAEEGDVYAQMLAALEAVLRRNLARFLGVQEVQTLLDGWAGADTERRALLQTALPDTAALLRFVQVLHDLLDEQVPVTDLAAILTAFAAHNPSAAEVAPVGEAVRLAVRAALPGATGDAPRLVLAPQFESAVAAGIQEAGGKRFLALPPPLAQDLLNAVRVALAGRAGPLPALVVQTPGLRPFVYRLLVGDFPALSILAAAELADGVTVSGDPAAFPAPVQH